MRKEKRRGKEGRKEFQIQPVQMPWGSEEFGVWKKNMKKDGRTFSPIYGGEN